jgi:translation initiation factor eIF-2B subunit gamma
MKVGRPPKGAHYVGLSGDKLLLMADEEDVDKVLKLRRPMMNRVSDFVVHTDLLDAQLYVLDKNEVSNLLEQKRHMTSLQLDVIPALVRRQFAPKSDQVGKSSAAESNGADANADDGGLMEAVFGVDKENKDVKGEGAPRPCCAHLAPDDAYCARVDTVVPALLEVSREIADGAVAAHLNGRRMSKYENFVDPTVVIGGKSTIGPGCIVGGGTSFGEKCSVKRSVVGAGCSVGSGVKLVNCVVMNRATIEDGATVQGSVIGPRAVIGSGASLRECAVQAEYEVEEGDDLRSETLQNRR